MASYTSTREEMFYRDALTENYRQVEKWGSQRDNPPGIWLAILAEELGEVAKAILENEPRENLYQELVQVAAVAASMAVRL